MRNNKKQKQKKEENITKHLPKKEKPNWTENWTFYKYPATWTKSSSKAFNNKSNNTNNSEQTTFWHETVREHKDPQKPPQHL